MYIFKVVNLKKKLINCFYLIGVQTNKQLQSYKKIIFE